MHTLFDGLEFRVLRDRLFETLTSEEEVDDSGFEMATTSLDSGQLAAWLAEHASAGERVGLHVVGRWGAGSGDVTSFALATLDGALPGSGPTISTPPIRPR